MGRKVTEICIPRSLTRFSTCTRHSGLPSSSYDHGSSCKGTASSVRPRTASHHHDEVLCGRRPSRGRDLPLLCIRPTMDDASGITSCHSAIPGRNRVSLHWPGRPGTAVRVRHNIFFHRVPAWGSPDICRASSVFSASSSSPASKKDRWHFATFLHSFYKQVNKTSCPSPLRPGQLPLPFLI